MPDAAISVCPGSVDFVNWDQLTVWAAGNCMVKGDKVIGYEDYTKMK